MSLRIVPYTIPHTILINRRTTPNVRNRSNKSRTGECKHLIQNYLKCLKLQRGVNDEECRKLAKGYLACRMDKCVLCYARLLSLLFLERGYCGICANRWHSAM
jgi:hypothetical protein